MSQLATSFFPELDRVMIVRIGDSSDGRGNAEVLHQPDPLSNRCGPYFLISPADLCRPIRSIVIALGFNPDGKSADHLTRADTIERRPVVTLAVHQALAKRISS